MNVPGPASYMNLNFLFLKYIHVAAEDTLPLQVNLTQDMSTIPSKRMNLAYFEEYFKGFC